MEVRPRHNETALIRVARRVPKAHRVPSAYATVSIRTAHKAPHSPTRRARKELSPITRLTPQLDSAAGS